MLPSFGYKKELRKHDDGGHDGITEHLAPRVSRETVRGLGGGSYNSMALTSAARQQ